jgi:NADH:ubiquinone oxidoreductase subunit K
VPAVSLVSVFFVAAALLAAGAFAATWRRDAVAAVAGIPLMLGGAGVALVGVTRFAARASAAVHTPQPIVVSVSGPPFGQEAAVLAAVAALALVALGAGIAGRAARVAAAAARQEGSR